MLNRAAYGNKKITIAIHFFCNHYSSLTYPLGYRNKVCPNGLVDIKITQDFGGDRIFEF